MSGMNVPLNDMNYYNNISSGDFINSMSSGDYINESLLPSNCMLSDQDMQMLMCNPLPLQLNNEMNMYQNDPILNIQQATPIPSPMNFKSVPPMLKVPIYNFNDPTCINSAPLFPMDYSYLQSPLNSPYGDNGYYFFNSELTSPTYNVNSGRRASTPATYLSAKLLNEDTKPMKRRNSSQGITKSRSSTATPKTYVCQESDCNKVFKRSEHLKRHIKSIHTNERPFHCQYPGCVKSFSRQDNLGQHLRIHRDPMEKLKDRGVTSNTPFVLPPCPPMDNQLFHMY